jgi:hypothetical protein
MSDTYQAIYDAVRSRISNADIGRAVEDHLRSLNLSHYANMAARAAQDAANEQARPCVVFKPRLFKDGDTWCVLLGENIHVGVVAFGDTPASAMYAFDVAWWKP